jgi:3-methyladenine DNA glycosylase AlkD
MGVEEYRKKLKERAKRNRDAFMGQYRDELNALLGLSKEEIDKITPGTTDLEVYAQLISVVKEASADNVDQAELKDRIMELGKVGIKIAKRIPALLDLLT